MAYPFQTYDELTKEQAEDWRIARAYAQWADSEIGRDLIELLDNAVVAAQKTLYENLSQDPHIAFGLMKRWQERGTMRDVVVSHINHFRDLAEQLKTEAMNEHNPTDTSY